jgi:hypothetical protein
MEEVYRGYRIAIEDRGLYFRVYVSPISPWHPILHCNHFEFKGTREEAVAEARAQVDRLLDYGLRN